MKLPAEQFAELFESLGTVSHSRTGRDGRRALRMEYQTSAKITLCSGDMKDRPFTVTVKDFSLRGIRILLSTPLASGAQFIIEIPRKKTTPVAILCTVMHSTKSRNDQYSIGAEFTCVVPPAIHASADVQHRAIQRIRESIIE